MKTVPSQITWASESDVRVSQAAHEKTLGGEIHRGSRSSLPEERDRLIGAGLGLIDHLAECVGHGITGNASDLVLGLDRRWKAWEV